MSPAELQIIQQSTFVGVLRKTSSESVSEEELKFKLVLDEFPHDANSIILVHESARGAQLEFVFR